MNLIIFTDGASRGNPGLSSYGFLVKNKDGLILHQQGKVIGVATNNAAEYEAVYQALDYTYQFIKLPQNLYLKIYMDSNLVAKQLSGIFQVKNSILKQYFNKIKKLETKFKQVDYNHIYREKNFLADRLANLALDKKI